MFAESYKNSQNSQLAARKGLMNSNLVSVLIPLVTCSIVVTVLLIYTPTRFGSKTFRSFLKLTGATLWWHGSWFFLLSTESEETAIRIAVFGHIGILYLPFALKSLLLDVLGIRNKEKKFILMYPCILILLLSSNTIIDGVYKYEWGYYPRAGYFHFLFLLLISFVVVKYLVMSINILKKERRLGEKKKIKLTIIASSIFAMGSYDFLLNYRLIEGYPYGFISSIVFIILIAIGLVNYDLFKSAEIMQDLTIQTNFLSHQIKESKIEMEGISSQNKELKKRDEIISIFLSATIKNELASGQNPIEYTAQRKRLTIMFIDMRGYTNFAESHSLDETYHLINQLFDLVIESVYQNKGEVDKTLGDGVLAYFNSPEDCLSSTNDLFKKLHMLNFLNSKRGKSTIKVGIGISHGEVLVGNFGSKIRIDRSIIGNAVNIASRLEAETKYFQCPVLADHAFFKSVRNLCQNIRPIGLKKLQGKSELSLIYEVFDFETTMNKRKKAATKIFLSHIFNLLINKQYNQAQKLLAEYRLENPRLNDLQISILLDSYSQSVIDKMRKSA